MKVGDTVPVTIAGQTIAQAQVKEIDTTVDPWTVRMIVPGTVVVMSMRAQLAPEITAEGDPATNVLLTDGVVKPGDGTETPATAPSLATTQVPASDNVTTAVGDKIETATQPVIDPATTAAVEEKATE